MLDQTTLCIINEMDRDSQPDKYLSYLTQSQFPSLDSLTLEKAKKSKTSMSGVGKKSKKKSPQMVEEKKQVVEEPQLSGTANKEESKTAHDVAAAFDVNPEPKSPLEDAKLQKS